MATPNPQGSSFPWFPIVLVIVLVILLSAFAATKKFAYWIGGLALLALLLPAWKKTGYKIGF